MKWQKKKTNKPRRSDIKKLMSVHGQRPYFCMAPFTSMSIGINGSVSPCCYTQSFYAENEKFDRYPEKSLQEIWDGKNYQRMRKMIRKKQFPRECSICYDDIRKGKYASAKLHIYSHLRPKKGQPVFLEITVDNTCNLECVMCSSALSSKIAARENIKPLHPVDHEKFKNDIYPWIPKLQEVVISGGEPFLSRLYMDIFREIIHRNPDCLISVNTNGNILTEEIKALMKKGRFHLNISIDSLIKERYEKIRKGGSFDKLQKHLLFFQEYAKMKRIPLSMPVCPLKYNFDEMGDIVRYCNENDIYLVVVHVFNAWDVALRYAGRNMLEQALEIYEGETFNPVNELQRQNVNVFYDFVKDIRHWLRQAEYRKNFFAKVTVNDEGFYEANRQLEQKAEQYFNEHYEVEEALRLFNRWKNKKSQLFDALPEYFRAEIFYERVFDLNTDILTEYILHFPIHELKSTILNYADNIVMEYGGF